MLQVRGLRLKRPIMYVPAPARNIHIECTVMIILDGTDSVPDSMVHVELVQRALLQ